MNDGTFAPYPCACCGEPNEVFVDPTEGSTQTLVEDCRVCCRPNVLRIRVDAGTGEISVEAEFEG